MRKNLGDRANVKGVYITYEIKGLNLDRFINYAKKQGVELYDVKKITVKRLLVTVKFNQSQKFFAIADKMCYNIKKVRYKGWGYPFFTLFKSAGLLVGVLFFFISSFVYDDFIVGMNFFGTGAIYKRQVKEFLYSSGVREFSRFSDVDLGKLEDRVLANNQHLSFVSLKKSGNILNVELALSTDDVKSLSGNVMELRADVSGEIESIKVYRGQPKVCVGDCVKVGDLLVDGVVTVKEQELRTNVVCSVSIICTVEREFLFDLPDCEENAQLLLESEFSDKEIISSQVIKQQKNDGYLYRVITKYRRAISIG